MNAIPSLVIVADRSHLVAYRTTEENTLEEIERSHFVEGRKKSSNPEEDPPIIAGLEVGSFRKISGKVRKIIDREAPRRWGFAAPSEINGAILGDLPGKYHDRLGYNLKVDLANSRPSDVFARFEKAASSSHP